LAEREGLEPLDRELRHVELASGFSSENPFLKDYVVSKRRIETARR
jgi:hypothetical protein